MQDKEVIAFAPQAEQTVCVRCGFCCDGTMFLHACLDAGERGNLPTAIEESSFAEGDRDYFLLPCRYFSGKCTIYDRKRANICLLYRCQLLKDLAEHIMDREEAWATVREAMEMRDEIIGQFRNMTGISGPLYFRQVLRELGKMQEKAGAGIAMSMEYEILMARCNIFEALLIRNFKSAGEFDKMVIS